MFYMLTCFTLISLKSFKTSMETSAVNMVTGFSVATVTTEHCTVFSVLLCTADCIKRSGYKVSIIINLYTPHMHKSLMFQTQSRQTNGNMTVILLSADCT